MVSTDQEWAECANCGKDIYRYLSTGVWWHFGYDETRCLASTHAAPKAGTVEPGLEWPSTH